MPSCNLSRSCHHGPTRDLPHSRHQLCDPPPDGRLVTALDLPFKDEDSVVVTVLATVSGLALRPLRPIACDTSGYATITANEML